MPLAHRIDHPLRLVLAWASGTLTDEEVFAYQNEVWSRPDVAGYDELVDMTAVEHVALPSIGRVLDLAALSAGMDAKGSRSRFAIVAPRDFEFALGRLYGTQPRDQACERLPFATGGAGVARPRERPAERSLTLARRPTGERTSDARR